MSEREMSWENVGLIWRGEERDGTLTQRVAARVQRQSRTLRLVLIGEVILTLLVLGSVFSVLMRHGTAGSLKVAVAVVLYTAAVWAFTLWNRRGIWQPYGSTTAEFLALLRLRAERRIRSAWFCLVVVGLAAVLTAGEIVAAWRIGRVSSWKWGVWIGFGLYSAGMIVWSVWYGTRARREVRAIDALLGE